MLRIFFPKTMNVWEFCCFQLQRSTRTRKNRTHPFRNSHRRAWMLFSAFEWSKSHRNLLLITTWIDLARNIIYCHQFEFPQTHWESFRPDTGNAEQILKRSDRHQLRMAEETLDERVKILWFRRVEVLIQPNPGHLWLKTQSWDRWQMTHRKTVYHALNGAFWRIISESASRRNVHFKLNHSKIFRENGDAWKSQERSETEGARGTLLNFRSENEIAENLEVVLKDIEPFSTIHNGITNHDCARKRRRSNEIQKFSF